MQIKVTFDRFVAGVSVLSCREVDCGRIWLALPEEQALVLGTASHVFAVVAVKEKKRVN